MSEPQEEVSIETGVGKFKARGSDLLTTVFGTIAVTGLTLLGYVIYEHRQDTTETGRNLTQAIKEMTISQKESVQVQRVMNCLIASKESERESKLPICERIAR